MKSSANTTLKFGLLGNALFSTLTGLGLIFFGEAVAGVMGIAEMVDLRAIGFILLFFAGHLVYASRRKQVKVGEVYYLSTMDALWVLGSVVLLTLGAAPFTPVGKIIVALVSLTVAVFMTLQVVGVRKLASA